MKSKFKGYLISLVGLIIFAAGIYLVITQTDAQGIMKTLPYVCIGVGSGFLGSGIGSTISIKAGQKDPEFEKKMEIEKKDERNVAISNRAKAKAYHTMIYVFAALMLTFALMGVDTVAVLLLVIAYILVIFSYVYWHYKYNKEM